MAGKSFLRSIRFPVSVYDEMKVVAGLHFGGKVNSLVIAAVKAYIEKERERQAAIFGSTGNDIPAGNDSIRD